jgi:hypothetical protein
LNVEEAEALLDIYTFEDIMNYNDMTEADALAYLVNEDFISPPNIKPIF